MGSFWPLLCVLSALHPFVAGCFNYNFNTRIFLNALLQFNTDSGQWSSNVRFELRDDLAPPSTRPGLQDRLLSELAASAALIRASRARIGASSLHQHDDALLPADRSP